MRGLQPPFTPVATLGGTALLVLLPGLLLLPFLHAGFVADDFLFAATPSPGTWDTLISPWAHPLGLTVAYRPITSLSYHLNQLLLGYTPVGFHAVNALIHGINAALLGVVVGRFTRSRPSAAVAALAFVLHPVTHESVVWISGRTYPLASMFSLGAIVWALARGDRPRVIDHVVLGGLVLAAVLSYEAALVLPLLLTALIAIRGGGGGRSGPWLTPWLALGAYLAVRYGVLTTPADDFWLHLSRPEVELGTAPVLERLRMNTLAAATRLLGAGVGRAAAESTTFLLTVVTCLVLGWAIAYRREAWRAAVAMCALVVIAFIPFATYIGFADRFGYLSAAGVAGLVGVGAGAAWASTRQRAIASGLIAVMLLFWGRQYALAAHDWVTAGAIAQDLLTDLHRLEPAPGPGAHLHFLDVPYRHGAAMVYITHLDRAVNLSYGRNDLIVSVAPAPPGCATVLRWEPLPTQGGRGTLRVLSPDDACRDASTASR